MIFLLQNWHPTDKQHSTCRRTASTSPRFVPAECDDTWSVVYQSGSLWFAGATGHRPPDYRNGVNISILTFLFWKSSPFPLPCGRMGRRDSEGLRFYYSRRCFGGPATSLLQPVNIKSCQNRKNLNFLKTKFNGTEVLKIELVVFLTNCF